MGVQLKTTFHLQPGPPEGRTSRFIFQKTSGYGGLQLLLLSFVGPVRAWLLPGDAVTQEAIFIPLTQQTGSQWAKWEIPASQVATHLHALVTSSSILRPVHELVPPPPGTRLREYEAFLWLQARLPLTYVEPDVEQQPWDYSVDGARWQAKLASYVPNRDSFRVSLTKNAGRNTSSRSHQQYGVDDFDWLAIQLPFEREELATTPPHMYLIPVSLLEERGLVGRQTSCSCVTIYPHRSLGLSHWTADWMIDLRDPYAAVQRYCGLVGCVS